MVFWLAGLVMMLVLGVSMRMLPLLDRHMREADWVGGLPPAACVLVAQSEHDGGVGGWEVRFTVRQFITPGLPMTTANFLEKVSSIEHSVLRPSA